MVLASIQVVRRFSEYAIAKPSRDMLFTAVDQQAKYKAKNVIDTVVYRFGDLTSSWLSAAVLPFGVAGLAVFGVAISVVWFPIAYLLGRSFERAQADNIVTARAQASGADLSKTKL
jgi:AAA family ATP:ADP antiporter